MVLLGNHRDAIAYGALDPGSGTAVMLEVARAFAVLAQQGEAPPPFPHRHAAPVTGSSTRLDHISIVGSGRGWGSAV